MPAKATLDLGPARPVLDSELRRHLHTPARGAVARAIALNFALLAGAYVAVAIVGSVVGWVVAFSLMVVVQTRMATLMHEAAHGLLAEDARLNDRLGDWLTAWPIGMTVEAYRRNHMRHHARLGTNDDQDFTRLCLPPIRDGLLASIVRSAVGWRHVQLLLKYVGDSDVAPGERESVTCSSAAGRIGWQLGLFTIGAAIGHPWFHPLLWLAPLFTAGILINEVRTIVEHTPLVDPGDDRPVPLVPLTRTIRGGLVVRSWFAPLNFNYHHEHHLYPGVPFSRLPELHRTLAESGHFDRHPGVLWLGYRLVLRALWSHYGPGRPRLRITLGYGGVLGAIRG